MTRVTGQFIDRLRPAIISNEPFLITQCRVIGTRYSFHFFSALHFAFEMFPTSGLALT